MMNWNKDRVRTSKRLLSKFEGCIKLVSEEVQSIDQLVWELPLEMDSEVTFEIPDFTNLALSQVKLENSINAYTQVLRVVQDSINSMNTRLTWIVILMCKMLLIVFLGTILDLILPSQGIGLTFNSSNTITHNMDPRLISHVGHLKFRRYNGKKDPVIWLWKCEQYFELYSIPEKNKAPLTSYHLHDEVQLWYQLDEKEHLVITWQEFKEEVLSWYGTSQFNDFFWEIVELAANYISQRLLYQNLTQ